jgi:N-acetylmuramoyl-L-alanine amidase
MTPVGAASSNDSAGDGAGSHAYPGNRVEDKSLLLAYQVQRSLVRSLGVTDRSVRRARWQVLRETEMPGILLEGGYMSQSAEARRIFDAGWRKQMAAALVRAVVNYQKLTAPPAASPATVAATNANRSSQARKK